MPTYQYACTECGEQLEVVQKFTDEPLTVCPVCEGRLRKLFSSVGIVFKGSGFYRTDSRSTAASENGSTAAAKPEPAKTETSTPATTSSSGDSSSSSSSTPSSSGTPAKPASSTPSTGGGAKAVTPKAAAS